MKETIHPFWGTPMTMETPGDDPQMMLADVLGDEVPHPWNHTRCMRHLEQNTGDSFNRSLLKHSKPVFLLDI